MTPSRLVVTSAVVVAWNLVTLVLATISHPSDPVPAPAHDCSENEVFNPCPDLCIFDQDCYSLLEGIFPSCTSPLNGTPCSPRCECLPGLVRLTNGSCGLPDDCCNDPFAELIDCPLPCNQSCPGVFSPCPQYCAAKGCRCRTGMVRNELNECVFRSQCPSVESTSEPPSTSVPTSTLISTTIVQECDDPNAELVDCLNPCPGGTCEQPEYSICPRPPCIALEDRGCQCKSGYVKDSDGKCLLLSECPSTSSTPPYTSTLTLTTIILVCKENQVFNPCPDFCTFDTDCYALLEGIFPTCSIPLPGTPCAPRCECQRGFVRLSNGSCTLPNACCNDPFAEVVNCPLPRHETCPGVRSPMPQHCGVKGCRCRPGMLKNKHNKCVQKCQCNKYIH